MTDSIQALWQTQNSTAFRLAAEELQRRNREMEKKLRRTIFDLYLAAALCSVVIIVMASLKPTLLQTVGAAISVLGLFVLARLVHAVRKIVPSPELGAIDYHRAFLERQLEFCRTRLWLRMAAVAPGPLVFLIGFAMAHPNLAPLLYAQIATFVVVVIAIVPLNRRAVVRLQRQIDELGRLAE
jgi:amino acid permease